MRRTPVLASMIVVLAIHEIAASDDVTPFTLTDHGEIVVPLAIGGERSLVILDTGSSGSVVSTSLAARLGARPVAKTQVTSALGSEWRAVVRLDRVELGPLATTDVLASVVDDAKLDASKRIQGLIGQDILSSRAYTVDFVHRRLEWNARLDEHDRGVSRLPLRPDRGRFLIDVAQPTTVLRLVPDTGAGGLVLFQPLRSPLPMSALPGQSRLTTLGQHTDVPQAIVHELHVGALALREVPAVLIDRPPVESTSSDGLLPLSVFARVTVDAPGEMILLESR